jgi:hypothetical protein
MKIYVRNRHKKFDDPGIMFPYQAVLWHKPEEGESQHEARHFAVRCHLFLTRGLGWSLGALARIAPQLVDTWHTGGDSVGVLFGNRKFADEAKPLWIQYLDECNWRP